MKLVKDGGFLVTCSCSHFMDPELFAKTIDEAARDSHVRLRQVEFRTQAPDHPILWNSEESYYLKFYIFQVCRDKFRWQDEPVGKMGLLAEMGPLAGWACRQNASALQAFFTADLLFVYAFAEPQVRHGIEIITAAAALQKFVIGRAADHGRTASHMPLSSARAVRCWRRLRLPARIS